MSNEKKNEKPRVEDFYTETIGGGSEEFDENRYNRAFVKWYEENHPAPAAPESRGGKQAFIEWHNNFRDKHSVSPSLDQLWDYFAAERQRGEGVGIVATQTFLSDLGVLTDIDKCGLTLIVSKSMEEYAKLYASALLKAETQRRKEADKVVYELQKELDKVKAEAVTEGEAAQILHDLHESTEGYKGEGQRYHELRQLNLSIFLTQLFKRKASALLDKKEQEIKKLQAFKGYVHQRLDNAGIPTHPDGEHSKHGCRIGDRLDIAFSLLDKAREEKWTPVETLPEKSGMVLIFTKAGDVFTAHYKKNLNLFTAYGVHSVEITDIETTHWQPRPEPPAAFLAAKEGK